MPSRRRGFAASPVVFLLGLALPVSATVIAFVQLRAEANLLRREQQSSVAQQTRLTTELRSCDARSRALDGEEARLRDNVGKQAISPERRRLIERGWNALAARAGRPASARNPEATGLLVQGKAGKIYFPELLGDAEYSKAAAVVERLETEITYGRLFARLNLTPEAREQLAQLLTERELAKQDILGLAAGADQAAIMQHRVAAARDWRTQLKDEFGAEMIPEIAAYDGTLLLQAAVDALETRLSHTATPLTPPQSDRLFAALVSALGVKVNSRYWSIPDRVLLQMQEVLAPAQLAALKHIQEEQLGLIEARDARATEARKPEHE